MTQKRAVSWFIAAFLALFMVFAMVLPAAKPVQAADTTVKVTLKGSSIDGGNKATDYVFEVGYETRWSAVEGRDAIVRHFTEAGYAPYLNQIFIMTRELSAFSSWSAVSEENGNNQQYQFTKDVTLYVPLAKIVDKVEMTVEKPLCGKVSEVTYNGSAVQVNKDFPIISAYNEQIKPFGKQYLEVAGAVWLDNETTAFNGTIKGGQTYRAEVAVGPAFGYQFKSDVNPGTLAVTNAQEGSAVFRSKDFTDHESGTWLDCRFIQFTIAAEHDWGDWEVTKPATASADGEETRQCRNCDAKETRVIPKKDWFTLGIGKNDGGIVTLSTKSASGQSKDPQSDNAAPGSYHLGGGDTATLTAVPDAGYRFAGWYYGTTDSSGAVTGYDPTGYITTDPVLTRTGFQDQNVYALFEKLVKVTLKGSSIDGGNKAPDYVLEVRKGTQWSGIDLHLKGKIIVEHFTEDGYTVFGNYTRIMTQPLSGFRSWDDVETEDDRNHSYSFDADTTLYVPLGKNVDTVELTVEKPLCGEVSEVTEDGSGVHVKKSYPHLSKNNDQIVLHEASYAYPDYTIAGSVWLENETTALNGTIKGGKACLAEIAVSPAFGYLFLPEVNPKTLTITNAKEGSAVFRDEDYTETLTGDWLDLRFIQFSVDAEHDWGEPTYAWADDNSTVTAQRVCKSDSSHVETETVNTTSKITKPATCTENGQMSYTAEFKNAAFQTQTKSVESKALGHSWGEATYTWAGDNSTVTAQRICKHDSSHVETETVTASKETTPATCERDGETTYTADFKNPAFSVQVKHETIPDLGHDWGTWTVTKAATETEEGTESRVCSRCGKTETRSIPVIEHTHKLVRISAKQPTCTEDGNKEYWICAGCGRYFEDAAGKKEIDRDDTVIEATGHKPGAPVKEKVAAPTCEKAGSYEEVVSCTVCKTELSRRSVTEKALGHDWSPWTVTKDPTETEEGAEERVCERCGKIETLSIPVLVHEHELEHVTRLEPTCTEDGLIEHWVCETCGRCFADAAGTEEIQQDTIKLPATGHTYGDVKTENIKVPKCETEGSHDLVAYCTVCGEEFWRITVTDEPLGHVPQHIPGEIKEPTCTEDGRYAFEEKCEVCGEVVGGEIEYVDALGHDWGAWIVTKEPTEDSEGKEMRTCARCETTETRAIRKLDPSNVSYLTVSGDGNIWVKGSGVTSGFTFKRPVDDEKTFGLFIGIQVDEKDVDASNYTAKEGSAVIELQPAYLETLSVGEHKLAALFEDGSGTAKFSVVEKGSVKPADDKSGGNKKASPKTGDENHMTLWLVSILLSAAAIGIPFAVRVKARRK